MGSVFSLSNFGYTEKAPARVVGGITRAVLEEVDASRLQEGINALVTRINNLMVYRVRSRKEGEKGFKILVTPASFGDFLIGDDVQYTNVVKENWIAVESALIAQFADFEIRQNTDKFGFLIVYEYPGDSK